MFPHPVLAFGGLGKPALVRCTVANRIFVADARARRGRRNDPLIDAGPITTVVIGRVRFNAASTFGTAIYTGTVDGDGSMRHELQQASLFAASLGSNRGEMRVPYETSLPTDKETLIHKASWIVGTAATYLYIYLTS